MSNRTSRPASAARRTRSGGTFTAGVASSLIAALALAGCDQTRYWICDEEPSARLHALPRKLSQTGLFADDTQRAPGPGVQPYTPRFQLWSDGATKRRWIKLPAGTQVDNSTLDAWVFPEGTQLWKEFTRDGVRVETRLLQKVGPKEDDWVGLKYLWADDQGEAYAAPYGAIDAQGTPHNVPAASECVACHGGTKSHVLGFSAIQLAGQGDELGASLRSLSEQGQLTQPVPELLLPLPGTPTEQAALGYLHANCSHCHNQDRPAQDGARCFDPENELDFRLLVSALQTPDQTNTYRTMSKVVKRGSPGHSRLFELVSHRGFFKQMPPLATERVDDDAVTILRAWIEAL